MRHLPHSDAARRDADAPRGSALIVAIWILGLLSLLISSFAFDMRLEAHLTTYYRNRLKAEYLARAGVEKVKLLLTKSAELQKKPADLQTSSTGSDDEKKPWYAPAKRLAQGLAVQGLSEELGEGTVRVDVVPEPARRNINMLSTDDVPTRDNWDRLLELGGVPEEKRGALMESFFDWVDIDNEPKPYGAETDDYYGTLKPPYHAKNGPLDTVEELLLIKGFTKEILFGGLPPDAKEGDAPYTGIADILTVYGNNQVNVNAASARVLMSLPVIDGDEALANDIIREREGLTPGDQKGEDKYFKSPDDFFMRFPELSQRRGELAPYVTTVSGIYRISCIGSVHGVERGIWAIVSYDGAEMKVLRWWEQETR